MADTDTKQPFSDDTFKLLINGLRDIPNFTSANSKMKQKLKHFWVCFCCGVWKKILILSTIRFVSTGRTQKNARIFAKLKKKKKLQTNFSVYLRFPRHLWIYIDHLYGRTDGRLSGKWSTTVPFGSWQQTTNDFMAQHEFRHNQIELEIN